MLLQRGSLVKIISMKTGCNKYPSEQKFKLPAKVLKVYLKRIWVITKSVIEKYRL